MRPLVADALRDAPRFLAPVAALYEKRFERCGADPRGVYWRNAERQQLRFEVLAGILDELADGTAITVNDLGCGYGAFFPFLDGLPGIRISGFFGYDIAESIVAAARQRVTDPRAVFVQSMVATEFADYSFASGTFNMKDAADDRVWSRYVKASLEHLWSRTRKGLAFNMLSSTDRRKQRGLYYADARDYLEFCRRVLSPHVSLKDNLPLADWTLYVRR